MSNINMPRNNNLWVAVALLVASPLGVAGQDISKENSSKGAAWKRAIKDRSQRGTLHDALAKVRGDSGKWNDSPSLQHAPAISRKPPRQSLDDWADSLKTASPTLTAKDDQWLLFQTRQLDDNDRVWIERIERRGNQITVVLNEAVWQGRYFKSFTYYNVFGVNLGKLDAGDYTVRWIVQPLVFRQFEGSGRPRDSKRNDNWSKDERPGKSKPTVLSTRFTVAD